MSTAQPPAWIAPGRAYPGWGWVVAGAGLWTLFALLLLVIGELQRGLDQGALSGAALGYYGTCVAALFVALCAFLRRRWAWQLALVSSAPMLLFFPIGTVIAGMGLRALWRNRGYFDASRS